MDDLIPGTAYSVVLTNGIIMTGIFMSYPQNINESLRFIDVRHNGQWYAKYGGVPMQYIRSIRPTMGYASLALAPAHGAGSSSLRLECADSGSCDNCKSLIERLNNCGGAGGAGGGSECGRLRNEVMNRCSSEYANLRMELNDSVVNLEEWEGSPIKAYVAPNLRLGIHKIALTDTPTNQVVDAPVLRIFHTDLMDLESGINLMSIVDGLLVATIRDERNKGRLYTPSEIQEWIVVNPKNPIDASQRISLADITYWRIVSSNVKGPQQKEKEGSPKKGGKLSKKRMSRITRKNRKTKKIRKMRGRRR